MKTEKRHIKLTNNKNSPGMDTDLEDEVDVDLDVADGGDGLCGGVGEELAVDDDELAHQVQTEHHEHGQDAVYAAVRRPSIHHQE